MIPAEPLLRRRRGPEDIAKVGMVELFFDLVFVFAVTQLSHTLLPDLSLANAVRVALMLLAVWWVWVFTSWVTNWLDPERIPVRICMFVLMIAGLLLAVSIPRAFAGGGLVFAGAYAFMQVGRSLFFLWAVRGERVHVRNYQRILVWLSLSGAMWLAGGFADEEARLRWWALALLVEFVGPWAYFWVPGLGRSTIADWQVQGSHLAERCALFVIIALGESLLVTGATFAELPWNTDTLAAFASAVLGSILMWWIYFDTGAERATRRIQHSDNPARQARSAYTYLHVPIVAGIIVCAVADEIVLAHPLHGDGAATAVIVGGPACYLAGTAWFKWVTSDRRRPPLSHLVGLSLLLGLAWFASRMSLTPLLLGMLTTLVLAVVAAWESLAIRRSDSRAQE